MYTSEVPGVLDRERATETDEMRSTRCPEVNSAFQYMFFSSHVAGRCFGPVARSTVSPISPSQSRMIVLSMFGSFIGEPSVIATSALLVWLLPHFPRHNQETWKLRKAIGHERIDPDGT